MSSVNDWTMEENAEAIRAYFEMLTLELRGERFRKVDFIRRVETKLGTRSGGAIQFKWGNISAVLNDLHFPTVTGYKEAANAQASLFPLIENYLESNPELSRLALTVVEGEDPPHVAIRDILRRWVEPPETLKSKNQGAVFPNFGNRPGQFIDYTKREQENSAIGLRGEEFVVEYEQARLDGLGCPSLAAKVTHVSRVVGDGEGYDILSFEPSGRERFIEVKSTLFGISTPFYATAAEVRFSREQSASYWLYRVFALRKSARLFGLAGALEANFDLQPASYTVRTKRASPKGVGSA